jgi:uncharacterized protein YjeT (DUF2065 family)
MKVIWLALAYVFIIEGLMPLILPSHWRETLKKITKFSDGQIRFIGLASILCGFCLLMIVMYVARGAAE